MTLKDRIGVDIGRRAKLEDGIAWAAKHGVRYIDIQLDTAANAIRLSMTPCKCARVTGKARHQACTLSAVNVAEYSPFGRRC
jgi:hypothetical protein